MCSSRFRITVITGFALLLAILAQSVSAQDQLERITAFADGRLFALTQLLGRMAVDRTQLGEDTLTDEQIVGLVEAFEVNSERTTSGRYIGNLTFAFDPAAVRNLLQARLIDFTEVVSRPVLVVPVFRSARGARLWDSPNPWQLTSTTLALRSGALPCLTMSHARLFRTRLFRTRLLRAR